MSKQIYTLEELVELGVIEMSRGNVISKEDIKKESGKFPIYSSSVQNNGYFGSYGKYMFDEELVSWSVDGGGDVFYRPKHKFSLTNVSGYVRVLKKDFLDTKFLAFAMMKEKTKYSFDYAFKAHPSVISQLYSIEIPESIEEQKRIAGILTNVDDKVLSIEKEIEQLIKTKTGLIEKLFSEGDEYLIEDLLELSQKKENPEKTTTKICYELEHIEQKTGVLLGYALTKNVVSLKNKMNNKMIAYSKLRPYLKKFFITNEDVLCSSEFWTLFPKNITKEVAYYLVQSNKFNDLANLSCGTKMPRADWEIVKKGIVNLTKDHKNILETLKTIDFLILNKKKEYNKITFIKSGTFCHI